MDKAQAKIAGSVLAGSAAIAAYRLRCINARQSIEPESFFEEWMHERILRPDEDFKKMVFREFLKLLRGTRNG